MVALGIHPSNRLACAGLKGVGDQSVAGVMVCGTCAPHVVLPDIIVAGPLRAMPRLTYMDAVEPRCSGRSDTTVFLSRLGRGSHLRTSQQKSRPQPVDCGHHED